jgi:hypothetical protein
MKATITETVVTTKHINATKFTFKQRDDSQLYTYEEIDDVTYISWVDDDGSISFHTSWNVDQVERFIERGTWIIVDVIIGDVLGHDEKEDDLYDFSNKVF